MSQLCKDIIEENDKLKSFENLNDICTSIEEYLKEKYHINNLEIIIKNKNESKKLYSSRYHIDSDLQQMISVNQNKETIINFVFASKNSEEKLAEVELILQIFTQSLYNKFLEKSINKLSLVDHVTGTYNRLYLDNYINNLLSISKREEKKIAFLKIGINQFKAVIDEFDYSIGDMVLKSLADTLKTNIRTSDIVIKIDGDEFLVILINIINEDNAIMISEKIINNFSIQKVIVNEDKDHSLMKTICSGITIYPDDASNIEDIIKKSDIALYEARNMGRSKTYRYADTSNTIDFF